MTDRPRLMLAGSSIFEQWGWQEDDAHHDAAFPSFRVVNAAVGGTVSADWLALLPEALAAHRPDAVALYVGSNDLNHGVGPERIAANVRTLAAACAGVAFCWFGVMKCPDKRRPALGWDAIDTLHGLLADVPTCDLNEAMLDVAGEPWPGHYVEDGTHLTPLAYTRLGAFVLGRAPLG